MDFNQSGLALDFRIFKAFNLYARHHDTLPDKDPTAQVALRSARALSDARAEPDTVAAALLASLPHNRWTTAVREMQNAQLQPVLHQLQLHEVTGLAYISTAAPAVRQLAMARGIGVMEHFMQTAAALHATLDATAMIPDLSLTIPFVPDAQLYEKTGAVLRKRTGLDALEAEYNEVYESFVESRTALLTRFAKHNIHISDVAMPGAEQPQPQLPDFADSGLPDTPDVRLAYALVQNHTRSNAFDADEAVQVARLVDGNGAGNPATVAAALIDIAVRDIAEADLKILRPLFTEDSNGMTAADIMLMGSARHAPDPSGLCFLPAETLQMMQAYAIRALENVQEVEQKMQDHAQKTGQTERADKQLGRYAMLLQTVEQVREQAEPLAGQTGRPDLDALLQEKYDALSGFLRAQIQTLSQQRRKPATGKDAGGPSAP